MHSSQQTPYDPMRPPVWPDSSHPPPPPARSRSWLRDFLMFRRMITPGVMAVLWAIGVVVITIGVIAASYEVLFTDAYPEYTGTDLVIYLVGLVLGWLLFILFYRVGLEVVAVLFRIHDRLVDIDQRGRGM